MIYNILSLGLIKGVIIFVCVIAGVSFHEFSHALVAHLRGDDTAKYEGRLTVNPIAHFEPFGFLMMLFTNFGWGKPVPINPNNLENPSTDNLLIAIAGPISNLILATIGSVIYRITSNYSFSSTTTDIIVFFLLSFVGINVGLAVFNLLPFPPLDGSNIYRPFLPYTWQYRLSTSTFEYMFILIIVAFVPIINGQSIISFIITPVIQFVTSILIGQ